MSHRFLAGHRALRKNCPKVEGFPVSAIRSARRGRVGWLAISRGGGPFSADFPRVLIRPPVSSEKDMGNDQRPTGEGRESKDERFCGCRMANELLILPLHLIQSALGQKVEAKPVACRHRERSQGRAVMRGHEVAGLSSGTGSHLGRSQRRATPSLAKFVLSAPIETGRVVAYAVSDALLTSVLPAITCCTRHVHLTDEVPRRLGGFGFRVTAGYKSDTKGQSHAPVSGTGSPRPRLWGCRQRQSRGACGRWGILSLSGSGCSERQNLRVPCGPLWFMGPVSPAIKATKWLGGSSSYQTRCCAKKQAPTAGIGSRGGSFTLGEISMALTSHVKERRTDSPPTGVHSVPQRSARQRYCLRRGRPVPERGTPVNMEN
jgi:hypothetical protein